MEYKYLKKWVEENQKSDLYFLDIKKFEDQYTIYFTRQKEKLQIDLSSNDTYLFYTKKNEFNFEHTNELKQWSKLLSKSKFIKSSIHENDRIISLYFEKIGIFNEVIGYTLFIELIPRYQNIILVQKTDNKIVDCLKKISYMENSIRQVLPGIEYKFPETSYKIVDETFEYPLKYNEKGKLVQAESGFNDINTCFQELYYSYSIENKINTIKKNKLSGLNKLLKRKVKKLGKLTDEIHDSAKSETYKQEAELVKANFHLVKAGMKNVTVKNYYSAEMEDVTIRLKTDKSPQQNIELLFKKYRKAKNAKVHLKKQIQITQDEIDDFEKQIFDIEHIETYQDAHEIIGQKANISKSKKKQKKYKKLRIDDDWEIFIGRTSKENDFLTTRLSKPYDWWFHTRIFRGTHILLKNYGRKNINEKLIRLCCRLAAYFSKAKSSSNVPVDYTEIRYVRKPHGAAPGFVTYKNQKTLYVDPISMRDAAEYIRNEFQNDIKI